MLGQSIATLLTKASASLRWLQWERDKDMADTIKLITDKGNLAIGEVELQVALIAGDKTYFGIGLRERFPNESIHHRTKRWRPCSACGVITGVWLESKDRWQDNPARCKP